MTAETPDGPTFPFDARAVPPEEQQALAGCLRTAFGLARGGAAALGHRRLRAGREQAVQATAPDAAWRPELQRLWDQGLRWYERRVAPPLR